MKRLLLAVPLMLLSPAAWSACVSPIAMLDATASTVNMDASAGSGTNCAPQQQLVQGGAVVAAANALFVQPGTGATWAATQSGTWNINNISGTISLPTGASTAAKQPALGTAGTASADVLTVQGIASMTALKVDGTGGSFPISGTVTANAGTNLNTSLLALESGGNLATLAGGVSASVYQENLKQVNGVTTLTGTGAVGTGAQRVAVGTDTATIAGSAPGTAGTASSNVLTVQGIASMTKLLVTPDANSAVNVAQVAGTTTDTNSGTKSAGTQRVVIATDQPSLTNAQPIGITNSSGASQAVVGCDSSVFKHITTATDTLAVQGVTAKVVRICGVIAFFTGSAAQTVFLENTASTNANCSSANTQITAAITGSSTVPDRGGWNSGNWNGLANTSGNGLCINSSGTGGVDVQIFYEQS